MKLHEYQAKKIFVQYGLPVPTGYVCSTLHEIEKFSSNIGSGPWVVKCQVHAGGRAKSGGIKVVKSKKEIYTFAKHWLGKRLITYQTNALGQPVNQILVETAVNFSKELYLSALVDKISFRVVLMASTEGGVEVEKIIEKKPHLIHRVALDPLTGPQPYQGRELAFKLGLIGHQITQFSEIFIRLAALFLDLDLALLEINPLVITSNGDLSCLDGKLIIDNNALFRQPKLREMRDHSQEDNREVHATMWKLNYVALEGNIGCMVNGAGLAMGTMDIVKFYGGELANFLDIGGDVTKEQIIESFKIILLDKKIEAVLVNIFGGIICCDLIADGIISAVSEVNINVPIVVRLEGNNSKLGIKHLVNSRLNIIVVTSLTDAAQRVVAAVEGK